ncbi:MAG: hypothetical protein DRI61_01025 [Chloroflexi bacterium]|nr:MAG: hypothetical protein DRI61_01025 [Chloroflexota bacterium]
MSKKLFWKSFAVSPIIKFISFVLAFLFLFTSGFGLYKAFTMPPEVEKYVPKLNYTHRGRFDYTVYMKPNILYESTELGPGKVYFLELTENMAFTFAYDFVSDQPPSSLTEEYQITATLTSPGIWQKQFVLVPETIAEGGAFEVPFSVPISQFRELLQTVEEETKVPAGLYKLTLSANVHSVAETEYGVIDETFRVPLEMDLEGGLIKVGDNLEKVRAGDLGEMEVAPVVNLGLYKLAGGTAFALSSIFLIYLLWMYLASRTWRPTIEEQVQMLQRKYADLIVEVKTLPPPTGRQTVVHLDSLDNLVKVAEEIYKPVLHKSEDGEHLFCVIDSLGTVRYEYLARD